MGRQDSVHSICKQRVARACNKSSAQLQGVGVKKVMIGIIWLYQAMFSALRGPACRFYPSCSEYALQAIETHGPLQGGILAAKRICKCHPYHPGGVDEVPPAHGDHQAT